MAKWNCGTLREAYSHLPKGKVVFFRPATFSVPRSVGTTYWVRPQGADQFYQIAESFGGPGMRDLISPKRDPKGRVLEAPPDIEARLNSSLRTWMQTLPKGARPYPPGPRPPVRVGLKDSVKL